jgi:drug/metabolite transporter (DMT)-like permease
MKKDLNIGAYIIAFAAFLWSLDALIRVSLYSLPPTVVVFWEHLLGAILLTPFAFKHRDEIKQLTKKEWGAVLIISLFSGFLGTVLYTAALQKVQYAEFSIVPLLQQTQPIWAILLAGLLLKEKITPKFLVYAGLGIIAAYFITFKNLTFNISENMATAYAGLFALLAGMMWASSTSLSKIVLNKVNFLTASLLRFWLVPIIALPFIFAMGQQGALFTLTSSQFVKLLMITFSSGLVALVIYYYGLKKTPARVSSIAELTWPASAIIIQYLLGNPLSLTQIFGITLLTFSIYHVSRFKK